MQHNVDLFANQCIGLSYIHPLGWKSTKKDGHFLKIYVNINYYENTFKIFF